MFIYHGTGNYLAILMQYCMTAEITVNLQTIMKSEILILINIKSHKHGALATFSPQTGIEPNISSTLAYMTKC